MLCIVSKQFIVKIRKLLYSTLMLSGHGPPPGIPLHHNIPPGADTDISNDSSPRGYPDFPPSPDSWLGEPSSAHY